MKTTTKTISLKYRVRGTVPDIDREVEVLARYGQLAIHANPYFETGDDKSAVGKSLLHKYTATHLPTKLGVLYSQSLAALKVQARVVDEAFANHEAWASSDYLIACRTPGLREVVNAFKMLQPAKRQAALDICAIHQGGAQ